MVVDLIPLIAVSSLQALYEPCGDSSTVIIAGTATFPCSTVMVALIVQWDRQDRCASECGMELVHQ